MSSMDNSVKILIWIIVGILVLLILYWYIKRRLKHHIEPITAFTGGLGSGKSMLSTQLAIKLYRKNLGKFNRKKWLNGVTNCFVFWKKRDFNHEKPRLYSNIPLKLGKNEYSYQLNKEILLLQERIPLGSVVYLDEIGAFANQFDWTQSNVVHVFDEFVRFFRHYCSNSKLKIQAYMVVNDQCSENINLVIRRRLNTIHNLSNFVCIWFLAFYYERMINISEEIKTIDLKQQETQADTQDNANFRIKILFNKKAYDTYCYRHRYDSVPGMEHNTYTQLTTNNVLRCPKDKEKKFVAKTK